MYAMNMNMNIFQDIYISIKYISIKYISIRFL